MYLFYHILWIGCLSITVNAAALKEKAGSDIDELKLAELREALDLLTRTAKHRDAATPKDSNPGDVGNGVSSGTDGSPIDANDEENQTIKKTKKSIKQDPTAFLEALTAHLKAQEQAAIVNQSKNNTTTKPASKKADHDVIQVQTWRPVGTTHGGYKIYRKKPYYLKRKEQADGIEKESLIYIKQGIRRIYNKPSAARAGVFDDDTDWEPEPEGGAAYEPADFADMGILSDDDDFGGSEPENYIVLDDRKDYEDVPDGMFYADAASQPIRNESPPPPTRGYSVVPMRPRVRYVGGGRRVPSGRPYYPVSRRRVYTNRRFLDNNMDWPVIIRRYRGGYIKK